LGEDEAPMAPRSSARIAASKAPNGVARGEGCPLPSGEGSEDRAVQNFTLKSPAALVNTQTDRQTHR